MVSPNKTTKSSKKREIVPLESSEQAVFVKWLEIQKIPFAHIPNEGKRPVWYIKKQKTQGLSAGVPDLFVFLPSKIIFVEMKRRKKSLTKLRDNQRRWLETINRFNYAKGYVAYGAEDAINIILEELKT